MYIGKFLIEAAKINKQRHKVYGNGFENSAKVLMGFFPDGIVLKTDEDHQRFHNFTMMLVKLTRYTTNYFKGGHEDSLHDLINYTAIQAEIDRSFRKKKKVKK